MDLPVGIPREFPGGHPGNSPRKSPGNSDGAPEKFRPRGKSHRLPAQRPRGISRGAHFPGQSTHRGAPEIPRRIWLTVRIYWMVGGRGGGGDSRQLGPFCLLIDAPVESVNPVFRPHDFQIDKVREIGDLERGLLVGFRVADSASAVPEWARAVGHAISINSRLRSWDFPKAGRDPLTEIYRYGTWDLNPPPVLGRRPIVGKTMGCATMRRR